MDWTDGLDSLMDWTDGIKDCWSCWVGWWGIMLEPHRDAGGFGQLMKVNLTIVLHDRDKSRGEGVQGKLRPPNLHTSSRDLIKAITLFQMKFSTSLLPT
jgi:hypothetical protein